MANISDGYGTATFAAPTSDDVTWLYSLFDSTKRWAYSTLFEELCIPYSNGEGYEAYCSFSGEGRWAYDSNIQDMFEGICYWLNERKRTEDLDRLKALRFRVTFDFDDYEPGCDVLYHVVGAISHNEGSDTADYTVIEDQNYDVTPENLVNLGYYETIEDSMQD